MNFNFILGIAKLKDKLCVEHFVIVCSLVCFQSILTDQHCIHDELNVNSRNNVPNSLIERQQKRRPRRSSDFSPIRFHVHYAEMEILPGLAPLLKSAINNVTSKMSRTLKVVPVKRNLLLERKDGCLMKWARGKNRNRCRTYNKKYTGEYCLNEIRIPDSHLSDLSVWNEKEEIPVNTRCRAGEGLANTDFVLYVRAITTSYCHREHDRGLFAYASHCQQDKFGRPIAGYINICPQRLQNSSPEKLSMTVLHELLHTLGFSKRLFTDFTQCTLSDSLSGKCHEIKESPIQFVFGESMLTMPAVSYQAQMHFNCTSSKFGAPLQKGKVEAKSHWDSYLMFGSIMTPKPGPAHLAFLDKMTLAVFEDSGWYMVDYQQADNYLWGKDTGCKLDNRTTCKTGIRGCHYLHRDKAVCKAFGKGNDQTAFVALPGDECFKEKQRHMNSLEMYSSGSRCFMSSITTQGPESTELLGKCLLHRCDENRASEIKLPTSSWIKCPYGNTIQIQNFTGFVVCPTNKDIMCPVKRRSITTVKPKVLTSTVTKPYPLVTVTMSCASEIQKSFFSFYTSLYFIVNILIKL